MEYRATTILILCLIVTEILIVDLKLKNEKSFNLEILVSLHITSCYRQFSEDSNIKVNMINSKFVCIKRPKARANKTEVNV